MNGTFENALVTASTYTYDRKAAVFAQFAQ